MNSCFEDNYMNSQTFTENYENLFTFRSNSSALNVKYTRRFAYQSINNNRKLK